MIWTPYDDGETLGQGGDDGGVILRDEEYDGLCRMTLEQGTIVAPFGITCGIYGWFFHTRFFGDAAEADRAFEAMRPGLSALVDSAPLSDDPERDRKMAAFSEAIERFVEAFP